MAACRAGLESAERAFIATYKLFLSLINENFEASSQPPQNDQRLYQLLRTANPHGNHKLIPRRENVPTAPPDAISIAFAKPVKVQNWRGRKASTLDLEPLFATRVRCFTSHDDGRAVHHLLELRIHGRAEAVYSHADSRTHQSSVCEKRENERAEGTHLSPNFDQSRAFFAVYSIDAARLGAL